MAITHIQDVGQYSGTSASITVKMTNTARTDMIAASLCMPASVNVVSVNDSVSNPYIRVANAASSVTAVELWVARGIQGGTASVTAVCTAGSVGINVSEWAGTWYVGPTDQWSQNFGNSASVTPTTLTPRTTGELVIAVGNCGASINGTVSGYTTLPVPGNPGFGAAYSILSGSVVTQTHWGVATAATWCAVESTFLPANSTTVGAATGGVGVNPLLQFPEVAVQVSQDQNYQSSFQGIATWTDISSYVESFSSNYGRQHELDRVQAGTTTIVVNNRDGTFNPWNTSSFLYPGGLDPMTPVRIVAAWTGVTSPISFTYLDSVTPTILDALNVNATLTSYDILKLLSLKYLNGTNYAAAILAGN